MTIGAYAKSKGLNKEEFLNLKSNIKAIATALIQQIPQSQKGNGMYYPISDIFPYNTNTEIKPFLLQEMKQQGLETIENGTLYRF